MARVKFKPTHPNFVLPAKATVGSAGYDFSYCGDQAVILWPLNPMRDWVREKLGLPPRSNRATVSLGFSVELAKGFELQIRPRSGLAHKNGITVLNSPGTVDSDYSGEIKAILVNLGSEPFTVKPGMRVCQGVFKKTDPIDVEQTEEEPNATARGPGGFGSSGV